jgi:hypothetical protein
MFLRYATAMAALVAALGLVASVPAAAAGPPSCAEPSAPSVSRVESARYVVVFRTRPAPIAVGEHFALEATVCPRAGAPPATGLRVDAHMPEHRHGMNYRASVSGRDGAYVAEGLLFHMPGRWQLLFDVEVGGRSERLVGDVELQ